MSSEQALDAFYAALRDDDAEKLYDRAPCGYLSTTPDGLILKVNATFLTLTGYERTDLVGRRTFADLLTGGGRIYHETHYAPLLRMGGTVRGIALDVVRPDRTRLAVLVNAALEVDDAGVPVIVRIAVFDATERRDYERELLRAKQRAEEAHERARALARTLQQSLIPPAPPDIPGLDVAAAYRPAGDGEEVGGDFYDVFEVSDGEWVIALGDVSGKGVEAAVITTLARHTLRAASMRHDQPSQALCTLNEVLLRHETDRFCTVAVLRLRPCEDGSWAGAYASGGHPAPVTTGGAPRLGNSLHGSIVGAWDDPEFYDQQLVLAPGDGLVLYTDGVTEARRGAEFFGDARLAASVETYAQHTPAVAGTVMDRVATGLLDDVMVFQSNNARDDIAIVAIGVPRGSASTALADTREDVAQEAP